MVLIIESIYLSKNVVSLQIKANEVYVKPLKPKEALLIIKESDDKEESENEEDESKIKTLNISDISDIEKEEDK